MDFVQHSRYRLARCVYELQQRDVTHVELEIPTKGETENYYFTFIKEQFGDDVSYIGVGVNISEQIKYEQALEQAVDEKNALLAEVHHRVKNNLAIVSGLLELEAGNYEEETIRRVLEKSQLRIQSIARIHEKLYGAEQFSNLSIDDYIKEYINTVDQAFDPAEEVDIELTIEPVTLNINQAIPLALILNELVVNAFQHAFEGIQDGVIWIHIEKHGGNLTMDVSDNGCGLPPDFDLDAGTSLGMTLVGKLVRQLKGSIVIADPSQSHFHIEFPIRDQKGAHSHKNW